LNGLLFLARADSQQAAIQPLKFKAAGQIATIAEFFETIANERGVSLRPHCDDGAEIVADRDLFKQAIANLVSNAIAHTPAGGTVSVSCEMTGEETLVHVEDTGRGIPAADQPHIFNRFYRAAGAPADSERLGLGLAITKSIVDLHGGRISCSSAPGGGTRMTLAFPVVSPIATTPGAA
jgi:two-component system heavy metal sensor histidine kinase CusS